MAFPEIVCEICDKRCNKRCPRNSLDEAIKLNKLEEAIITYADKKAPLDYRLPLKNKKVAIIGAGISGMACALRLSEKNIR